MATDEADNELCRMFFRKRARIWVGRADWRHDYDKPFTLEGQTYYLSRHGFYVRDEGQITGFRPAKHLLETLRAILSEREQEQDAAHDAKVTARLLRGVA
jgi:hypothetical protein